LQIGQVGQIVIHGHNIYKAMSNKHPFRIDPRQTVIYKIRVKGHLGRHWTDWFEGMAITLEDNGDTLITGPVVDQAALHALLKKVRDLGITLISVNSIEHGHADISIVEP